MSRTKQPSRSDNIMKTHPRRVMPEAQFDAKRDVFEQLAQEAKYIGIWYHKKEPEKFRLKREGNYNPDKSLCDAWDPPVLLSRTEAQDLLSQGIKCGLISAEPHREDAYEREWPRNIWAVTESGVPLEAKYDGREGGVGYHGYPLPDENTPLYNEILERWQK